MKKIVLILVACQISSVSAQTDADSLTVTLRAHADPVPDLFVPGQFNNWGPNTGGVIAPGAPSKMTYAGAYWIKTYTFKIHDPADPNRNLGDSVYQYKFNSGGGSSGWYSDPLNPESNPSDNNNSVLRLAGLFWLQFYGYESGANYTAFSIGLAHRNTDSVTAITFETGLTSEDSLTILDVTGSYNRSQRILTFTPPSPIPKSNYLRLVAYNNAGDSVVYKKISYAVKMLPMPPDARLGVTLPRPASGDSTTLRIDAPGRSLVLLKIAPLGQSLAEVDPIVLHKDPATNDWWRNLALQSETVYEYVYEFDNGKRIFDPWGRWSGTLGTRFSTGPEGLAADNYIWASTGYERPPLNRLVIYELNVGEFTAKGAGAGGFLDLIEQLPHFNTLGVNAIELMPINDYGIIGASGFSWGYDLSHHFALEPAYGTPAEFKQLVDSAHARGIAIIVDAVYNHLNDPAPLWEMQPSEALSPYFKLGSDPRYNEDGLLFFKDMDHFTQKTQDYVYESLKMWIDEYRVDGFRYDYTQGIGWDTSNATMGILGWANRIAQEYNDSIYQIAEHLPESPALVYLSGLTGGWHDSFRDEIFDDARFENTTMTQFENLVLDLGAYSGNDTPSSPSIYGSRMEPVNATVTHDEQSLIFEMVTFQGDNVTDAVLRDKVYAVFMFTSLGIPMLWQGMEYAEPRGWASEGLKLTYRPVQWNRASTEEGGSHFNWYKWLAYHRRFNPALYQGTLRKIKRYSAERALVWGFDDAATGTRAMIVANLSPTNDTLTNVPWLSSGSWHNIHDESIFVVSDTTIANFFIPRYSAQVFSNKSRSELAIPVSVENNEPATNPSHFGLSQNYPNPFNPTTRLQYDISVAGFASVKVFNILGELVAVLAEGDHMPGRHTATWRGITNGGAPAGSGVYFVRLESSGYSEVKKILLIR
ncbi:MAG TPA: alpha-amylase family glycosyl hydrolase [Bacteroidota bacterium]